VISLQVVDCWLWSLIILLIQRFLLAVLEPHSLKRGCGGAFPPTNVARGVHGGALKRNIGKYCIVKYCNFVVNLDLSL
jgi:hypothetical protein